jgi:hypothetical protein
LPGNVTLAAPMVCRSCGDDTLVRMDDFHYDLEAKDYPNSHPDRCLLCDGKVFERIIEDGRPRQHWHCRKRAGHAGACSSHNDCGARGPDGVICGDLADHEGQHQWAKTPASESAPPTFTLSSIEAASCIYEDCRARGQSAEDAMRKSVGRLIPSSASSETPAGKKCCAIGKIVPEVVENTIEGYAQSYDRMEGRVLPRDVALDLRQNIRGSILAYGRIEYQPEECSLSSLSIAHDFETMRTALIMIRDECFNGHAYDIAERALADIARSDSGGQKK